LKQHESLFKWRHYEPSTIILCVRWYCRYQLSYRDVEEMMKERGLEVAHSTVLRWVQRYAPEINKRVRPHLKMSGTGGACFITSYPRRVLRAMPRRREKSKG
jgi:transposase, IS6 family